MKTGTEADGRVDKILFQNVEMWRLTETGSRGGRHRYYMMAKSGEREPDPWQYWHPTRSQARRLGPDCRVIRPLR